MVFWSDHDVSGWGWALMSLGMIAFWALLITAAVLLFRALERPSRRPQSPGYAAPTPEQLLAERFARGEIDEDEYKRRLAALHTASGPHTGT